MLHDLGSGCLLDTTKYGLAPEPMPQTSIAAGASLAFVSGDKLLGGPQAGIVAGTEEMVGLVSRHPLARAVRIDKLSMAALSANPAPLRARRGRAQGAHMAHGLRHAGRDSRKGRGLGTGAGRKGSRGPLDHRRG